ncbi:MAG: hypothetical protein JJU28_16285 [Cyclobacteriaceae bacterium]|nr:hypothetical protein [Cyclobacteriaceae bacterium]
MNRIQKFRFRWLLQGGIGAVILGVGLALLTEASFMRFTGAAFWNWFLLGTVALSLIVAALAIFTDSLRFRIALLKAKKKIDKSSVKKKKKKNKK